ncbi:MAG: hypothetical protein V4724_18805 [Pseudomonadota bacterium]
MNWREFTGLTAAMAGGHAESNAAAINRALNKQALTHAAHCWQRFSHTGNASAGCAPEPRPSAPSSWLPPLP